MFRIFYTWTKLNWNFKGKKMKHGGNILNWNIFIISISLLLIIF
jgi:hypothetical protein